MPPDPSAAPAISHWFDGSILGILALGAVLGFFRGVIRQILWVASVGAGVFAAWWLHRQLSTSGWNGGNPLLATCSVAGFVVYWIVRKVCSFLTFIAAMEMTGGWGLLAGIVPSGGLVWLAGLGVRWFGAQDHLSETAALTGHSTPATRPTVSNVSVWSRAKHALDESFLGRLVGWADPVTSEAQVKLSKLLILANHPGAIDKMPHPAEIAAALQQPKVQALLQNAQLRFLISKQDFAGLLHHPALHQALQDPSVRNSLAGL